MEREWQFFFFSVLYGMLVPVGYDLIRSLRNTWKHGKILIAAEDLLFWMATGVFLFTRLYKWNNGILRWYFFAGVFLGMLLYAVAISPWVVKIVSFFLKRLKMFFSWVNIILKRTRAVVFKILGINNGENVEAEKEEKTCEGTDETE